MDEKERIIHKKLCYCNICENVDSNEENEINCRLTQKFPEFEIECPNFSIDQDKFLTLEKNVKEDIRITDNILRTKKYYYNDDTRESYEFIEFEYPIQNLRIPDEYIIKSPVFRNLLYSGLVFGFVFIISYTNINKSINQFLSAIIGVIIGMVPAILLYLFQIKKVSKIIVNRNGIIFKGNNIQKIGWGEVLYFFIKKYSVKTKGGVDVSRYFKINYISGYSELFPTEDFLTDYKSTELLNWANHYHRMYWSQFIQKKQHKLKYKIENQKTVEKYSIMRVSYKNSLYLKELNFLQDLLTYPLDYYNDNWKQTYEKSWHFIATDIHKIIGCAVFMPDEKSKTGELILIAVDKNWRRKGLGKELINEIITHCKYKRISKIYCSSFAEHIPFLRKMDFKEIDESYDNEGLLRIQMGLEI